MCVCVCRTVVLPCASFCEAAREGCEPVLQMFNATWPDFLRCSQFSNSTPPPPPPSSPLAAAGPAHSACYTPRQLKGKACKCTNTRRPWRRPALRWSMTSRRAAVSLAAAVCGGRDFLCATGICVPQKLVCNGYNDCDDWSDEAHCGETHAGTHASG